MDAKWDYSLTRKCPGIKNNLTFEEFSNNFHTRTKDLTPRSTMEDRVPPPPKGSSKGSLDNDDGDDEEDDLDGSPSKTGDSGAGN
ncbi:hypothetical protein BG003_009035 [Podila horticola]|nr:hypothetical protein BG003_009035 [Podila horticola]